MSGVLTGLYWVAGLLLAVSALLAVARMIAGPTVLNRALANDVLISIIICALGLEAVVSRHSTTLPILITLALLGFTGTVAIARFVARDVDENVVDGSAVDGSAVGGPHTPLAGQVDHQDVDHDHARAEEVDR